MSSHITEVIPLSFAQLDLNEHVLCSVILNEVVPVKMFILFGPVAYQQNYIRYHGHLTEKRLILEIFPYSSTENIIFKSVLTIGKYMSPNFALGQSAQYSLAKIAMNNHDLQVISIPYSDILSVEIVKSLGIGKYVKVKRKNQDVLFFNVFMCGASDMDIRNITPSQWKANYSFIGEFIDYFQGLLKKQTNSL